MQHKSREYELYTSTVRFRASRFVCCLLKHSLKRVVDNVGFAPLQLEVFFTTLVEFDDCSGFPLGSFFLEYLLRERHIKAVEEWSELSDTFKLKVKRLFLWWALRQLNQMFAKTNKQLFLLGEVLARHGARAGKANLKLN